MIETRNKILLVQPRHNYAPPFKEKKLGHIYMPTSLLTAAAILDKVGITTQIVDENISQTDFTHNIVGINLLGAPYIPLAIEIEKKLEKKYGNNFRLLLGGQVVSGLSKTDFSSLFSEQSINGNEYKAISEVFGISEKEIPFMESVSLINIYEQLGNKILKLYLSTEFGFYLSQGCKHSCSFCAAHRTITEGNRRQRVTEKYRDINIALSDFEYLVKKAIEFKLNRIQVYLSNLDLFQNPLQLFLFADGIAKLKAKYPSFEIRLRGLSTCSSFLLAHKSFSHVVERMVEAGLEQIGFGIDGATPQVYKATRKPQKVQETLDTVEICRTVYNITPETLMVFGHNNIENEEALKLDVKFCKDMQIKFGAVPRPHIAKDMVPGNDGWMNPKNENIRQEFYANPMLFQNLDFTAVPSPITHPNSDFRTLVAKYYSMVCELPNSLTQLVLAELPTMTPEELAYVRLHNKERYDI